ncbi:MAG: ATP-binding cassette domain-containing protein [Chitinophagaceae bacterium]
MINSKPLIELKDVSVKAGGSDVFRNVSLTINQREQWAFVGNSGTGKTSFALALMGRLFYRGEIIFHLADGANNIMLVEQQHRFKNLSNTSDFYYQQRFNSSDADNSLTVEQALSQFKNTGNSDDAYNKWIDLLQLNALLQEPLIQLSNGENKRLQLAEALLADPAVLIMDNPFIGLDIHGRKILHDVIDSISQKGIHVILITSPQELPAGTTHVGVLENKSIQKFSKKEYNDYTNRQSKKEFSPINKDQLNKIEQASGNEFLFAIKMKNVSIQYGDKKILDDINWEVKRGECWNVSGPNGAGKSTLLSLVTADNPQAYANEIYLFDERRGRGESIWDIKRKIGYVSPELHLFFEQHNSCFEVIASGLFDTIGLFRQLSEKQEEKVNAWIELLQLEKIKSRLMAQLSLGQQRMVLLARALVKNPPLLILDEPCQGLDDEQADYFKNLVDQLCKHFNTTLLYVSHYQKDIPSCVNNYLKLEKGKQQ